MRGFRSFPAGAVELQLTIMERDTPSRHTTLEAWIAGRPRLVATSAESKLGSALSEVRDDLVRQLTDVKNRTEPRNNRHYRSADFLWEIGCQAVRRLTQRLCSILQHA